MNRFAHRRPAAWTRAFGLLGIVLAATQCSKTSEPRLTLLGRWHAAIGTDAETTTVFIDVDTLISGRWIAEADIPSEELSDVPLSVELHGDTVRLQLVAGDESAPTLVARVPTAGTMQGVYTAEGATLPARLVRVGPPEISD